MKSDKYIETAQEFARQLTIDLTKKCKSTEEAMSLILYTCATAIDDLVYADMKDELLPTQMAFTETLIDKLKDAIKLAREVRIGMTEVNQTKIITKGV